MPSSSDDLYPVSELSPHPACPRAGETSPARLPREKLLRHGAVALSNTELLAIIIGLSPKREGVLRTAERAVRRYGVERLPKLTLAELRGIRGIGDAHASRLAAVFELQRRLRRIEERDPPKITTPAEVHAQVLELRAYRQEHLIALYLDATNALIAKETISIGSLNTTRTHPREILFPAIQHLALGFVLIHNHPSGSLTPSVDDVEFTRSVRRAGEIIGIDLYDHVIVSSRGFVSMKEKGLL